MLAYKSGNLLIEHSATCLPINYQQQEAGHVQYQNMPPEHQQAYQQQTYQQKQTYQHQQQAQFFHAQINDSGPGGLDA